MDRLGERFDLAVEKCKQNGFSVFKGFPPDGMRTAWWNGETEADWDEFLATAKAMGAKMILVGRDVVSKERVEAGQKRFSAMLKLWDMAVAVAAASDDEEGGAPEPPTPEERAAVMADMKAASGHCGQTGMIKAVWIRDDTAYAISDYAGWWDEFTDAENFLDEAEGVMGKVFPPDPEAPEKRAKVRNPNPHAGMIT